MTVTEGWLAIAAVAFVLVVFTILVDRLLPDRFFAPTPQDLDAERKRLQLIARDQQIFEASTSIRRTAGVVPFTQGRRS